MSRCVLNDEDRGIEVAIGWDPGTRSFFVRIFDTEAARRARRRGVRDEELLSDEGFREVGLVLWTGCHRDEHISPNELRLLIAVIQPYAGPHDQARLYRELLRDQASDDGERRYSLLEYGPGTPLDEDEEEEVNPLIRWLNDPTRVRASDVYASLDALVRIEPDDAGSRGEYEAAMAPHRERIHTAMWILRRYAEQIEPQSLEAMRREYYMFTNDPRYLRTPLVSSVVTSALTEAWDGVGPWRR